MAHLLDVLRDRVLLCDGGMGTCVQAANLDVDKDFWGHENCTDILTRSRPDLIRGIHRGYFEAGADFATTNTFGTSPVTLGEFGLQDEAFDLSKASAELAREAADDLKADGRTRFILGDIGPGTKLPSLGHIGYDRLEDALTIQCAGLLAGGIDAFLLETCQDTLQIKAGINAAKRARAEAGRTDIPIFVQVTVETTGTLLIGADIAAATTTVRALGVDSMGLNCATGPQEMAEHIRWLSENWPGIISVQPNAGLPELVDGETRYPLKPDEHARWLERFIEEDGVNIVGGCCGTDTRHIAAVDAMLRRRAASGHRPAPKTRTVHWVPAVASLYGQVPLRQENAFFSIGERCNANGSKKFRELQDADDWDGCVAMGREQTKEGSHALDVCTAFVGRNEIADMTEVVSRMRGAVTAPLVFDSTELPVLETALKLYGGKPIINSINFEDGEEAAEKRMELARRFGAAVIALTIDEEGMAKNAETKVRIAKRLKAFACDRFGLPPSDLLIDPLTFTVCTGNEDDRKLALETLEAIRRIREELPECQIILGLSNISFGLKAAARHVLNSVFLDEAVKAGMTGAIVHLPRLKPLHQVPEEEARIARDLLFDNRAEGYDPLQAYIGLFTDRTVESEKKKERPEAVEDRLKQRIVDGDRLGLEDDLNEAMKTHPPLDIVNNLLLDGMKVVGELFGAGKMQLPFVLQSAETMKAAVAFLEPHMEKADSGGKGRIVLATVKGDVHDIGKNLVDIILTNNGYEVVNLGIKQPIADILKAARDHKADAVGMSGLLVKSTVVMRENLEEMTRQGFDIPVLLGGAALTRRYVEDDCVKAYGPGRVAYARDAFDGLELMDRVRGGTFDDYLVKMQERRETLPSRRRKRSLGDVPGAALRPVDWEEIKTRKAELLKDVTVPGAPFLGARVLEQVPLRNLTPYLNENMLYVFHWGYRREGRNDAEWRAHSRTEYGPILKDLLKTCERDAILKPQAVYGFWKCAAEGNAVILFDGDSDRELTRFDFPRQNREGGLCIADFFRDVDSGVRDVIGLQVVTMGSRASEVARDWFGDNRYQDYLYLHGLSVEMAEALAEYIHKTVRAELGIGGDDARDVRDLFRQGYQGSRYSFGYPACPNLADQRKILQLLGADRIGIEMADEDQLHPEQSTSAIVVHHPQAKYFSV